MIDLSPLCYRKINNIWCKPFGWSFFTFSEDDKIWQQWFKSLKSEILIWDKELWDGTSDIIEFIKTAEEYRTKTHLNCSVNSSFELNSTYENVL